MSKNYAIIIHFMLPLTTFYRSGVHRSDVYKWDAFVTSWRFYNRAWQPQRHDRLPETSGTLWIHRGALTNQRCSLATGCGIIHFIMNDMHSFSALTFCYSDVSSWKSRNSLQNPYVITCEEFFIFMFEILDIMKAIYIISLPTHFNCDLYIVCYLCEGR